MKSQYFNRVARFDESMRRTLGARTRGWLCLLLFASATMAAVPSAAFAQWIPRFPAAPGSIPKIPTQPTFYAIPYVGGDTARFAYYYESGNSQYLRLVEMLSAHPQPRARVIKTLEVFDTPDTDEPVVESIRRLSASPDNRTLLVYALEEAYFSDPFFDFNLTFYDMRDGRYYGLVNEHRFSGLNKTTGYSQVYEDYIRDVGGADFIANSDFTVRTEGILEARPDWQWNADGTVTVQMTLDVHHVYPDGSNGGFIDSEVFYQTFGIGSGGLTSLGFGPPRAAATMPSIFSLTPRTGPPARIQFNARDVSFQTTFTISGRGTYTYNHPLSASKVEGNIPRQFRLRYGY